MNRTKIEWTQNPDGSPGFTWNPASGCYGPGGTAANWKRCPYCYARRVALRFGKSEKERAFIPMWHPDRLDAPLRRKKPARIFVGSMTDLFGSWVPASWIHAVIGTARKAPQHTFMFLTKNPALYRKFDFPSNCWLGATTVDQKAYDHVVKILGTMPPDRVVFFSAEPMLGRIVRRRIPQPPNWLIIGAQTGPGAVPPKKKWVDELTAQAGHAGCAVFHKDNLGLKNPLREFPEVHG